MTREQLIAAHIEYKKRDRTKDESGENCPCDECGCDGNSKCGHEPLNNRELCTLDSWLVCPCCIAVDESEESK